MRDILLMQQRDAERHAKNVCEVNCQTPKPMLHTNLPAINAVSPYWVEIKSILVQVCLCTSWSADRTAASGEMQAARSLCQNFRAFF